VRSARIASWRRRRSRSDPQQPHDCRIRSKWLANHPARRPARSSFPSRRKEPRDNCRPPQVGKPIGTSSQNTHYWWLAPYSPAGRPGSAVATRAIATMRCLPSGSLPDTRPDASVGCDGGLQSSKCGRTRDEFLWSAIDVGSPATFFRVGKTHHELQPISGPSPVRVWSYVHG
jgi:hypothetical protein